MKKRLLLAAGSIVVLFANAQIVSQAPDGYIDRAVMMYEDDNFFGCLDQLRHLNGNTNLTNTEQEKLLLYRALATVHTDKYQAINLLNDFLTSFPQSKYRPEALLALGDCYYGRDYQKALEIYTTIDPVTLSQSKAEDLLYRTAYSWLQLDDLQKAQPIFESLSTSSKYSNAAKFYQGYIAYAEGNYPLALQTFKEVDTSLAPGNMANYYLSQIYFMRKDYSNALSTARSLLKQENVSSQYMAEAYRVAGESSYQLGQDAQAIKYLKQYVSMVEVPLPSSLYILGVNAYNMGEYSQAIEYLSPVTECDDAMGQAAYLYLGEAYLHQDEYDPAAMALNRALNMDYDPAVRETAYYNYAVASLRGGKVPFGSAVKTFSDFLKLYPRSQYAPDVQEYIITSYLTDNNYTAALQSINQMEDPSAATLAAKQRVLYVLGVRALSASNPQQALAYLKEAKQLSKYDKDIDNETSLALGETYYVLGNYPESIKELKYYISKTSAKSVNRPLAFYDLGYALFAQKNYKDAAKQFQTFLDSSSKYPSQMVADAYNRLGDCYYQEKDFGKAIGEYDAAYSRDPSAGDYSLFQKALMAGYMRDYNTKIDIMRRLEQEFPTSALIPDAMLETTESYIQLGKNSDAIDVYSSLVSRYPNTAQARQGYLQMALVKLNSGNRTGAIADYKMLIQKYPTSEEAAQAVNQMKRIAAEDGTINDFMAFLKSTDRAPQIDESEIEQLTFESAEKEYLSNKKTERLVEFVEKFPESNQRARALSYLIEAEYAKGDIDAAYEYANTLIDQYPSSGYAQNAYITKAQIEEAQGKGNLALRTWLELSNNASSPSALHTARMGIIRNGRESDQYDEVLQAANAVIATSGVGADDMAEAIFSRGLVNFQKGNLQEARNDWERIADKLDNLYGIESAYYLGQLNFDAANYTQAEKWAKKVANADSPYQYWIARGFILLSDVYQAQGDAYKARQYLEAVRDNYAGEETDIFEMIDQRLNKANK